MVNTGQIFKDALSGVGQNNLILCQETGLELLFNNADAVFYTGIGGA